MGYEWEILSQEEVQAQKKIPLPDGVKDAVGFQNKLKGPCIHFNVENNAGYVTLSRYPLREKNYQDIGKYKIHGIEKISQAGGRIRIPSGLDDVVKSHFLKGLRVNYMAYQRMIVSDNPTVFLLSNNQLQRLLPESEEESVTKSDDDSDLQQSILNLPAFLPPV